MDRDDVLRGLGEHQDELFGRLAGLVRLVGANLAPRCRPGVRGVAAVLRSAQPGDQVAFRRVGMEHWHHGIYAGPVDGAERIWDLHGPARAPLFGLRDFDEAARGAEVAAIVDYGPLDSAERRAETLRVAEWISPVFNAVQRGPAPIPWGPRCTCDCLTLFCRTGGCARGLAGAVDRALALVPVRPASFKP